jgi:hypothetical protein
MRSTLIFLFRLQMSTRRSSGYKRCELSVLQVPRIQDAVV